MEQKTNQQHKTLLKKMHFFYARPHQVKGEWNWKMHVWLENIENVQIESNARTHTHTHVCCVTLYFITVVMVRIVYYINDTKRCSTAVRKKKVQIFPSAGFIFNTC